MIYRNDKIFIWILGTAILCTLTIIFRSELLFIAGLCYGLGGGVLIGWFPEDEKKEQKPFNKE